jgi:hypothetical protein
VEGWRKLKWADDTFVLAVPNGLLFRIWGVTERPQCFLCLVPCDIAAAQGFLRENCE